MQYDESMEYDIERLVRLGRKRARLIAETKANLAEIEAEIPIARAAKIAQDRIAHLANVSRTVVQRNEPKEK